MIVRETLPYSLRKVLEGHPFWYSNLDELPPEAAADRVFLEKHGPRSNLSFPLVVGGSAVGGLAFGTMQREREWPEALRDRLAVVAEIAVGDGVCGESKVYRALVHNHAKLAYHAVGAWLQGDGPPPPAGARRRSRAGPP